MLLVRRFVPLGLLLVAGLAPPARSQSYFEVVEEPRETPWSGWSFADFRVLPENVVEELSVAFETERRNLPDELNRMSYELGRAVRLGGAFCGYDERGSALYSFDGLPSEVPDEQLVDLARERIGSRLGAPVEVNIRHAVRYRVTSLLLECAPDLADRLERLELDEEAFGPDVPRVLRELLLRERFGPADGRRFVDVSIEGDRFEDLAGPETLTALAKTSGVLHVSADHGFTTKEGRRGQLRPNDDHYARTNQWGLWAIDARNAWRHVTASPALVAVVDSGVDLEHPDLKCNLWTDPETGARGLDLTSGADVDRPQDTLGHGTIVAGIIGAVGNNARGVTGVCWQVEILPIRITKDGTIVNIKAKTVQAIDYALKMGADVINLSFVPFSSDSSVRAAFERAEEKGVLVVTAAATPEHFAVHPASYGLTNVINVMGVDSRLLPCEEPVEKSHVDIAAPAEAIFSTFLSTRQSYSSRDGTSMATAFVSGAAALLEGHQDYAAKTPADLKAVLVDNARWLDSLSEAGYSSAGILDLGFVAAPTDARVWKTVSGEVHFPNLVYAVATVTTPDGEVTLEFCGDGDLREDVRDRDGQHVSVYGKLLKGTDVLKVVGID